MSMDMVVQMCGPDVCVHMVGICMCMRMCMHAHVRICMCMRMCMDVHAHVHARIFCMHRRVCMLGSDGAQPWRHL